MKEVFQLNRKRHFCDEKQYSEICAVGLPESIITKGGVVWFEGLAYKKGVVMDEDVRTRAVNMRMY
ncbi:MAG: hypothetical protein IKJ37_14515 [Kiritimatiellae bacterium]|nr:hypothetical protein [Kiritimatiellia bacterium]